MNKYKRILLISLLSIGAIINAQTNEEIASVYFKKAFEAMEKADYKEASIEYEKGVNRLDSVNKPSIAKQGVLIYYELKMLDKAKELAKTFFNLSKDKNAEVYAQMLRLYVDIEDGIAEREKEEKRKEEERQRKVAEELARQRELRRIDSLKTVWQEMSDSFSLKADTIFPFSKSKVAIYEREGKFGLISERGKELIEAKQYMSFVANNDFAVFTDKTNSSTEIFYYNIKSNEGINLPKYSNTHEETKNEGEQQALLYDRVFLSKDNNLLVIYSENYPKTLVFDLEKHIYVNIPNLRDFLRELRKNNKIERYNTKENTIRVDKITYYLGNHLGNGVFTLYGENRILYGFLFTETGEGTNSRVISKEIIDYLEYFGDVAIKAEKGNDTFWIGSDGIRVDKPQNGDDDKYEGKVSIKKTGKGKYQLIEEGIVILEDKKLIKLDEFLSGSKKLPNPIKDKKKSIKKKGPQR